MVCAHMTQSPRTPKQVLPTPLVEQAPLFDAGYWLWRRVMRDGAVFAELARPAPMQED